MRVWVLQCRSLAPDSLVSTFTPSVPPSCAVSKSNNYKGSIYMVFDFAEYDLTGLMESQKSKFTEAQVR